MFCRTMGSFGPIEVFHFYHLLLKGEDRMRLRLGLLPIVALAVLMLPRAVKAADVTARLGTTLDYQSPLDIVFAGTPHIAYTGVFVWTRTDGGTSNPPSPFYAFCIELTQGVGGGLEYSFNRAALASAPNTLFPSGMGADKADFIAQLWHEVYDGRLIISTQTAAAFQAAIWEIIYDGTKAGNGQLSGGSLAAGNFQVGTSNGFDTSVAGIANGWLTTLDLSAGGVSARPLAQLAALVNADAQDQVYLGSANEFIPAPLPGAAVGAIAPVLMFAGSVLKSKRRHQKAEQLSNA
jgi:hypothetical protein